MIPRFLTKLAIYDLALLNISVRCVASASSCPSYFNTFTATVPASRRSISTTKQHTAKTTKEELLRRLSPLQHEITQKAGTERAFTGKYLHNYEKGIYQCVVCNQDLFSSEAKYDSGSGWPSFFDVIHSDQVEFIKDSSHGMDRTEVVCGNCKSHLGHVFEDGPEPTGSRYCMNSASLHFVEDENV